MSSIITNQYIRKPLYVDATRVTGANFEEIANWCQGEIRQEEVPGKEGLFKKYIRVRVQNPKYPWQTKAFVGDWILYTDRGGYKVYNNKAFHASFEMVSNGTQEDHGNGAVVPSESNGASEPQSAEVAVQS
jgi:hypothetical protein